MVPRSRLLHTGDIVVIGVISTLAWADNSDLMLAISETHAEEELHCNLLLPCT